MHASLQQQVGDLLEVLQGRLECLQTLAGVAGLLPRRGGAELAVPPVTVAAKRASSTLHGSHTQLQHAAAAQQTSQSRSCHARPL